MKKYKKTFKIIAGILIFFFAIFYFFLALPLWGIPFNSQRQGNPPLTPSWALECWLWEDDVNTAEYVDELLQGYQDHDIPVRTIILDSPWSYRYNDFEVDTVLYPNPDHWFKKIKDQGYRVVLWMTPMVNSFNKGLQLEDSNAWYKEAKQNGYLVANGDQNSWWKGKGGFIDYSNPEAMKWWRGMQQSVFDLGIDGWKLDGAATLFWTNFGDIPIFYKKTASGLMTTRTYMDHYYRDEYTHGLSKNPEFITLSRSMDRGFHPEGFSPIDASPVNWVGDQEHKWITKDLIEENDEEKVDIALEGIEGFESAIESILKSAKLGYNIIGSDVAGFSGSIIPPRLYIRWTQFSTFCGLFMNGGHGERRLWKRSKEELEIIREFSWLHTELVPYMYHYVHTAHAGGQKLQTPLNNGKYHYMFGDDLLIAPIYKDELKNSVSLPKGKWRYWFDDSKIIEGPITFEQDFPLNEYPVFIKEGAIIPMNIKREYTGIGNKENEGYMTLLIYPDKKNEFTVYNTDNDSETMVRVSKKADAIKISLNGEMIAHIIKMQTRNRPKEVSLDNKILNEHTDYLYDSTVNKLIIKTEKYSKGEYLVSF